MNMDHANNGPFPETSLTLFQRMVSGSPGDSREALEEFFSRYWYPMYAFMRARGATHEDASDLVQGFVMKELLERDQIRQWQPERGRLRTFLKVALDRYRLNEHRRESAQKRGGRKAKTHVSMDFEWAEGRFENTAIDFDSPDKLFEREWAEVTVQKVISELSKKYAAKDKSTEFLLLCQNLSARAGDGQATSYRDIATQLNTTENNVKQKMIAFRALFKKQLEQTVSETVDQSELESEVQFLTRLVSGL